MEYVNLKAEYAVRLSGTCKDMDGREYTVKDDLCFRETMDRGQEVTLSSAETKWPWNIETIAKELGQIRRSLESMRSEQWRGGSVKDRSPKAAISAIDRLWRSFFLSRALFPRMDESLADHAATQWTPPDFYSKSPYRLVIMKEPITRLDVQQNNETAHWLNENFLVRLYALLEVYGIAKVDAPDAHGYDEYRIVRRLRHKLAHGSTGRYDNSEPSDRDALARLVRSCPSFTPPDKYGGRFDLSISDVLWPLVVGVRRYAADVLELDEPLWALEPTPPGLAHTPQAGTAHLDAEK